jgi:SAM-dependent methyltransferase
LLFRKIAQKWTICAERVRGLDFSSIVQPSRLGFDESLVFRGSPSGNAYLKRLITDLCVTKSDSIIDIGCAKGSAIRCMSDFPFRRVDGIEISTQLAAIARKNFARLKKKNVEIFNLDARNFTGFEKYNFFYFYNPFPASIMVPVIRRLWEESKHQEAIVIYNNPVCHNLIESVGFVKMLIYPDEWGNGINIYSNKPEFSRLKHLVVNKPKC